MSQDRKNGVTEDREMIEANVRRIIGIAALRRIHRIIVERKEGDRLLRAVIAPAAVFLMAVIAALIWTYGSPRAEPMTEPLPQCSPAPGERVSI
jgi:hypothetical protein